MSCTLGVLDAEYYSRGCLIFVLSLLTQCISLGRQQIWTRRPSAGVSAACFWAAARRLGNPDLKEKYSLPAIVLAALRHLT
ncbi:hypothetical protein XELAEV_18010954mg [Xenopus laevis]|uniref:Uncharacterized protein n=1 Tax=Xenopus laevis TaxID=8355 RepID=A0A974DVI4_XENLA|nr:hypothetical protein XELAEV_18010954mg [Xenopus laevis]